MLPSSLRYDPTWDRETASNLFDELAVRTRDIEGVSRPAFSEIETQTLEFLEDFACRQGLAAWRDEGRNLLLSLPDDREAGRRVIVGSHVDSVPFGGNFDGLAGVAAGILCLVRARRSGAGFARPTHVLAMRGEESAWFGPCYIGSKALTGTLQPSELASRHRGDRRTLAEHMADVGIPTTLVREGVPLMDLASVSAFVELHIEQGPLLVGKNIPAAVVSGIRGSFRHKQIRCVGEAGHSGAVPRAFRRDPVLATAELLTRLDEHWSTVVGRGHDLVLTCGIVSTDPAKNALSRIPDEIRFSLDIRSQSATTLEEMRRLLRAEIAQIERERHVSFLLDEELRVEPAHCDPALIERLKSAMASVGQEPFVMPSGGGHDAAVFAGAGIPSAMVFVRNRNGSHNPMEAMEIDDFLAATDILDRFLRQMQ